MRAQHQMISRLTPAARQSTHVETSTSPALPCWLGADWFPCRYAFSLRADVSFHFLLEGTAMDPMTLVIQLISGAVGGNVAGLLAKAKNLGPLLNSVLGALGGAGGGQVLTQIFKDGIPGGQVGNAGFSAPRRPPSSSSRSSFGITASFLLRRSSRSSPGGGRPSRSFRCRMRSS